MYLLDFGVARGANAQLLSLVQINILAALAQNACRANARANRCANRSSRSAAKDCADRRADSRRRANFGYVAFCRIFALHAAFWINLANALAGAGRKYFNYLCADFC